MVNFHKLFALTLLMALLSTMLPAVHAASETGCVLSMYQYNVKLAPGQSITTSCNNGETFVVTSKNNSKGKNAEDGTYAIQTYVVRSGQSLSIILGTTAKADKAAADMGIKNPDLVPVGFKFHLMSDGKYRKAL